MNEYRIRRAAPGDASALVKLGRAVSSEPEAWLITEGDWRNIGDERRYLRAVRRLPHAAVFVAENKTAIVGRLSLAPGSHPASHHVPHLAMVVAHRHPPQGVGRT